MRKSGRIVRFGALMLVACSVIACSTPAPTATPSPAPTPTPGPFSLTVLYTNDGWGYTEPCACDPSIGGLARRAAFVKSVRAEAENVLLVDAGDSLLTLQRVGDLEQGRLLAEAFNQIGYDAVGLGGMDFRMGLDVLREQMSVAQFSVLSANTLDPETEEVFAQEYAIVERANRRIALIGVTDPSMLTKVTEGRIPVIEPVGRVYDLVSQLEGDVDVIIVLSHLGIVFDINMGQVVPDVDLIVSGLDMEVMEPPLEQNGIVIVSAGGRGEFVGRLDLEFDVDGNMVSYEGHVYPMTEEVGEDLDMRKWMTQNGMIPATAPKSGGGGGFTP